MRRICEIHRAEFSFGLGLTVEWKRIMEGTFSLRTERALHRSCSILPTRWKMPLSNRNLFSRFSPIAGYLEPPREVAPKTTQADSRYQIHTSKITTNRTPRPCGPQLPSRANWYNFPIVNSSASLSLRLIRPVISLPRSLREEILRPTPWSVLEVSEHRKLFTDESVLLFQIWWLYVQWAQTTSARRGKPSQGKCQLYVLFNYFQIVEKCVSILRLFMVHYIRFFFRYCLRL